MSRRPVDPTIDPGRPGDEEEARPGVPGEEFREALSQWPSGVALVAVRDGPRVYAVTVTSFASASLDPPLVLVALGPNANVVPFLDRGAPLAVSVLAASQRRLASVYADAFPVGPSPFPPDGPPVARGSVVGLVCTVHDVLPAGDHRLVLGRVDAVVPGAEEAPLLRHRRAYGRPADE